jgi:hypothetical protein
MHRSTPTLLQFIGNPLSISFPPLPGPCTIFSAFFHNTSRIQCCLAAVNEPQVPVAQTHITYQSDLSENSEKQNRTKTFLERDEIDVPGKGKAPTDL